MKLVSNIVGKIWWIQNFLDDDTYKGIHNAIIKERKKINLHDANKIWDKNLTNNLSSPKRVEVSNYPPFEKLKTLVKHNPFFQIADLNFMSTTIHFMQKNSGINWHNDNNWKYGATYYINNRWSEHWGGEFMFKEQNSYNYFPIVGNSLVIIKSPLTHKVNTVLTSIVPRISVQIFMK
tara:strand:+ start:1565 stop:2098 length:534 start_codon:yes stop_codon:yes gene_type:complete